MATHDGGPRDIIANCRNGILVDPLNDEEMGNAIAAILSDPEKHRDFSETGHTEVRKNYAWAAHVQTYLGEVFKLLPVKRKVRGSKSRGALVERESWVVMDLLPRIENETEEYRYEGGVQLFHRDKPIGFGIATGSVI